ncbi:MAG: selenocysteine-specific translation elongation factor [Rubripirellula sp.]|nr:selenocysteine-specific translation elongation factor [Rhodopirellula sp.]MCH1439735.1 selenocysteine-specific translation elongation factor [Rubripirellula sp.]OUX06700.1 MAG: selenocysteine-specific translation elongation factor [Planctomycetaceae bacterium TMED240]
MSYTIIGVIGHIDHGKTSLVAALTGVDTDSHPEEKRRGITIDLGFATFTHGSDQFALIDAPGHQKYIGNLLAGVSAVDVGLLVVACDQGIQAQTLEHAAILQSLGVSKLIVAMSRIDLVDANTQQELREELELFLAEFGFEDIPQVPLSSVTGEGLDELRSLLSEMARTTERSATGDFRMPIDRVFTVEGRGCVAAGSPWSGLLRIGDQVQIARTGQLVRVREIEVHGSDESHSRIGVRTALNLAGVSAGELTRGDELVSKDTHHPASRILVDLKMFVDAGEIKCPTTIQFHTATSATAARIFGPRSIPTGGSEVVIVDLEQPVVATPGQACLLRRPYPVGSFAGGRILGSVQPAAKQTTRLLKLGKQLCGSSAAERLTAWIDFLGECPVDSLDLQAALALDAKEFQAAVLSCIENGTLLNLAEGKVLTSPSLLIRLSNFILKTLTNQAESMDDAWLDEQSVTQRANPIAGTATTQTALTQLIKEKKVVRVNRMIAVPSEQTVLSKKQLNRMNQLLSLYRDERKPPTLKEAAAALESPPDTVASLIRFATQQRILIDLGRGFFISQQSFDILCNELRELFSESPERSVAEIRDHWGITRKHAIPLLEFCDKSEITIRNGDSRVQGKEMPNQSSTKTTEPEL